MGKHQAGAEFNGVEFIPLAFEALGAWGKQARDWLSRLAKRLGDARDEEEYSIDQSAFCTATRRDVSVAIQRGNAQAIIYRSQRDRFASGRGLPPAASIC